MKFALRLTLLLLLVSSLQAQDRHALILANTENGSARFEVADDAEALATRLKKQGWVVRLEHNLPGKEYRKTFEAFATACPDGGISMLYFAGCGIRFPHRITKKFKDEDGNEQKETIETKALGLVPAETSRIPKPYHLDELAKITVSDPGHG